MIKTERIDGGLRISTEGDRHELIGDVVHVIMAVYKHIRSESDEATAWAALATLFYTLISEESPIHDQDADFGAAATKALRIATEHEIRRLADSVTDAGEEVRSKKRYLN